MTQSSEVFFCKSCLTPSTRPRITWYDGQICGACTWAKRKKEIDWNARQNYFRSLHNRHPIATIPFGGGKDSIWVAYRVKKMGWADPILMIVLPHMETEIGKWNRENMCRSWQRINIELKEEKYRSLARKYFVEQGRPKHPWETAVSAVVINQTAQLGQQAICVYGEDGEVEYSGNEQKDWRDPISKEWLMKHYYYDHLDWDMPTDDEFDKIFFTQWSNFENWNPLEHAAFAESIGMKVRPVRSIGTLERRCQISDSLESIHKYLQFVKYGFGRATSDLSILIRAELETRDICILQCEMYDDEYPIEHHKEFLDYFGMSDKDYWNVIREHTNWDLIEETGDFTPREVQGVVVSKPFRLKEEFVKVRRQT